MERSWIESGGFDDDEYTLVLKPEDKADLIANASSLTPDYTSPLFRDDTAEAVVVILFPQ